MFISFEGGDGSGKSTVCKIVKENLEQLLGKEVLLTREPGGSEVSEKIRNILLNDNMDPMTEALLFAASRREHLIKTIIPALEEDKIVLSDRFVDSSLAYQGYARDLGIDKIVDINLYALEENHNYYYPDLTFYFDIDPELGLARAKKRGELNRLDSETLDFHNKVRNGFKEVKFQMNHGNEPKRIIEIDASKPLEEVCAEVLETILARL